MTYFSTIEDYSVPDLEADYWYWHEKEDSE